MKHQHADVIHAWANGAQIQYFYHGEWVDWESDTSPSWGKTIKYRIKPEPKPDLYIQVHVTRHGTTSLYSEPNLRLSFDDETGELKSAEVLK